jgi:hypothetical protein
MLFNLQVWVPELQAENEKLWQLIQRLLRHRYGPRMIRNALLRR